jgi:putative transcriptional regulator
MEYPADVTLGLLIASPVMRDPNFSRSVVLICQHDEEGAIGLIINRPGPVSMEDVISRLDLPGPSAARGHTWWGGPVGQETGFVIWRGNANPDEGWNLGDQVAVSPSAEQLGALVAEGQLFHLCLGYAGWGPGQLDYEVSGGSWVFADIEPIIIFETPLEDRYDAALASIGLTAATLSMQPIDA